jgi:hypothetical protein
MSTQQSTLIIKLKNGKIIKCNFPVLKGEVDIENRHFCIETSNRGIFNVSVSWDEIEKEYLKIFCFKWVKRKVKNVKYLICSFNLDEISSYYNKEYEDKKIITFK